MAFKSLEKRREYFRKYYKKRKEYAINKLGGKCVTCDSKENLNFDHKDYKEKDFPIGKLMNVSKDKFEKELKKCQLLCFECHVKKTELESRERIFNRTRKLLPKQVKEIKIRMKRGLNVSLRALAREYNISHGTLSSIRDGKIWKYVEV